MLLLTIRTDKPDAEIGLYDDATRLSYEVWPAHRQLAETIHQKITDMLQEQHKQLSNLSGIVCFQGPGSFTGLRIGLTVANALAMGLSIPVVGTQEPDWINIGVRRLLNDVNEFPALPYYGADVHITQQKK